MDIEDAQETVVAEASWQRKASEKEKGKAWTPHRVIDH